MAEALCADSAVTLCMSPFSVGNTSGASHFHTCHLGSSHMPQISSLPERGCVLQLAHIPNGNDLPNPYQAYNQENRGCVDSSEVKNPPPLKKDPGSVPSNYMVSHNYLYLPRDPTPSFDFFRQYFCRWCICIDESKTRKHIG